MSYQDHIAHVANQAQLLKDFLIAKGKFFGMTIENLTADQLDGTVVEFTVRSQELILNFGVYLGYEKGKNIATIGMDSPNKKGTYQRKATGKNASPQGIYNVIENIFNGKYKK